MTRDDHLRRLATLPPDVLESIAAVVESAELQGDYVFDDEGSYWEDSTTYTLHALAGEVRRLKQEHNNGTT